MSRKRRQVELPPIFIGPQRQGPDTFSFWLRSRGITGISGREQFGQFLGQSAKIMKNANESAHQEYLANVSTLAQGIEKDIVSIRQELGGHQLSHSESLKLEIAARGILIERKTFDLNVQRAIADSYYGSSPLGKHQRDFVNATLEHIKNKRFKISGVQQALKASYSAAYTVQLRETEIRMLHEQVTALDQMLADAQAQARADAEAQARAHAEALDRARAEAQALAEAQAQARAHAEAVARANEEARQRAQAEANARQIAAAAAAARREMAQQAIRAANTYTVQLPLKAATPVFVMTTGAVAVLETGLTLTSAIRSAILALGALSLEALAVGVAALLYTPKLGNGELQDNYLLSTPLTDLTVDLDGPAQAAAIASGTLDLPLRMGAKREAIGQTELFVARTSGPDISSKVRVLPAQFDAINNHYTVSTQDTPSRTLVWTPAVSPSNGSTTSPASPPSATTLVGPSLEPIEGRLDTFPDLPDIGFDDYVIIFPADSGLPPLYVMFKSPRHMPGIVDGKGELINGTLLGEGNAQGTAIPAQIANELRGKEFSNFGAFRRALWKTVSRSPTIAEQFGLGSIMSMRRGFAPTAPESEQVGGRIKYEIHHKIRIADGGAVYDIDNMIILSPKLHILMHKNGGRDE